MTERENFIKWMDTCPITDYDMCKLTSNSITYKFNFNIVESIDQLIGDVLIDLEE